jgi:hypothetical protein
MFQEAFRGLLKLEDREAGYPQLRTLGGAEGVGLRPAVSIQSGRAITAAVVSTRYRLFKAGDATRKLRWKKITAKGLRSLIGIDIQPSKGL